MAVGVGAIAMIPWMGYLASTLPLAEAGGAWRVAWVGFDVLLTAVLLMTAWMGFHRRQVAILGMLVAATMLIIDAWFDTTLSYGTHEQWGAILSAVLLEVPFAVFLAGTALGVLRRTSATVWRLRGHEGSPPSFWHQQYLISTPQAPGT